ncbi:hypothetical protein MMC21_005402 [Puttea exsequens]|nr:hypothetical protein [Puttea exsequens]
MVFEQFGKFARPYITTLSKPTFHGYAQSFAAASQSSSFGPRGTQNKKSKVTRTQTAQLHAAARDTSGVNAGSGKAVPSTVENLSCGGNGFANYLEGWKRAREEGEEWQQGSFQKSITWKPASVEPDAQKKVEREPGSYAPTSIGRGTSDRSYSTSVVDDINKNQSEVVEAVALAKVDDAIAQEINLIRQALVSKDESRDNAPVLDQGAIVAARSTTPGSRSPNFSESPQLSDATAATSAHEPESNAFSEHISRLYELKTYGQIPAVFESMLIEGQRPSVNDYNALLGSAMHLPVARHQVVPKALDIYSDMLRRRITPDTTFYSTLIQVLASRALEVLRMKEGLEQKRLRFGGMFGSDEFLLASNDAENQILLQDDAIRTAIKIFNISTATQQSRVFSPETYQLLIISSAKHGLIEHMIQAYSHMEANGIKPIANMFPPMIEAFARSGDLVSALESYNGYRSLAMEDNSGKFSIIDRKDDEVYAALVKAYLICEKSAGADRFLAKIVGSYTEVTKYTKEQLQEVEDALVLTTIIQERLDVRDFVTALRYAEERLSSVGKAKAKARICASAADHGDIDVASQACLGLSLSSPDALEAAVSMFALRVRRGEVEAARELWSIVNTSPKLDASFSELTALYASLLIQEGRTDEALSQARATFAHIRSLVGSSAEVMEEIDEAIEFIGSFMATKRTIPSPNASANMLWMMIENGGPVSSVAEQILAGLGPQEIASLDLPDRLIALQITAGLLGNEHNTLHAAHSTRFEHLLDLAVSSGAHLDENLTGLIEKALGKIANERPNVLGKWHNYQRNSVEDVYSQQALTPQATPATHVSTFADTYDPYAANTDFKGSATIMEELETRRSSVGLNEALHKFRNIRRSGRHPRYITYAKLLTAAAKEGRTNLMFDILGMARTDVPLLSQYPVVQNGWSAILDSMVGACLTVGRRQQAAQFHQEMLELGTAPTANTFGLYITTLKESTKTFDEASEAVAIFARAIAEGVTPSSFLYNALIGKLGKARRIDDCLRYFQEMRAAGIRPTSVTYGTVVNALCRVSDDRFAEELFDEMESMPNYKPRPAPYNSLMQFFLGTKRDSRKVLEYYKRMQAMSIQPTMHTYKLLIDTYATLEPTNLAAAEGVLETIQASGQRPEAVHYASLIHAKGCALHDMPGARHTFDEVLARGKIRPQACIYQALFESMVANHCVAQTEEVLASMSANGVGMTPYIANTLIHGWAMENAIDKSKSIYDSVGMEKREPSTYEAMTRAFLTTQDRDGALHTVNEMLSRGYPAAVSNKIMELVGHGMNRMGSALL